MSLDALAPDQRAVVQLVLQQDRSYEDLAGLLGITPDAVRDRAHGGLERLAPGEALDPADRAQIADYLLGQQSVSGREATRALLSDSQPARSWAHAVSTELASVARSPLPEIPQGAGLAAEPAATEPEPEPIVPIVAGDDDPLQDDPVTPTRARPRPRPRAQEAAPADFGFGEVTAGAAAAETTDDQLDAEPARTSRLGGFLLIAGLAILVAALVVWLVNRGDDDVESDSASGTTTQESTPTPSGTPNYQPLVAVRLKPAEGQQGNGNVIVFAAPTGEIAFNVEATGLEPSSRDEAYALWLTGGPESRFLGFTTVDETGELRTSGPRTEDAPDFAEALASAENIVISRETADPGAEPAEIVLSGQTDKARRIDPNAAATPTP